MTSQHWEVSTLAPPCYVVPMTRRKAAFSPVFTLCLSLLFLELGACNGNDSADTEGPATGITSASSASSATATTSPGGASSGSATAGSSISGDASGSATTTATGASGSTGAPETSGMTMGSTDTGPTAGDPICGNGVYERGEECDDGNDVDNDKCSNDCAQVPCAEQAGGEGAFDFSYIWIANASQGTVSKIDTQTLVELGRYRTDPSSLASPSRTAVNVNGRFAAVANRAAGTIVAFAAHEDDCIDRNKNGTIETSSGADDILPFGEEECLLWHITVEPNNNNVYQKGPRPLGWDFADQDPSTCAWQTHNLWTGWYSASGAAYFWHLDGTDGSVLDSIEVPVWGNKGVFGPYGGAVDSEQNFWVAGWHGPLARINAADLTIDIWNDPILNQIDAYGMALDAQGRPWFGGGSGNVVRFDPKTETFKDLGDAGGILRGLMVDRNGTAWIAGNQGCRLVEVDTNAETITNPNIEIPGCDTPVGVSIDAEGFVWIVDNKGVAFKMNPEDYSFEEVDGLVFPYTYSDMTGAGIQLQALIPQ